MRFYDDYIGQSPQCDVPISMTLKWNEDRTAMTANNVVFPKRYPKVYRLFGCERLKEQDMTVPATLFFKRNKY